MKTPELVAGIVEATGYRRSHVRSVLDAMAYLVRESVANGDAVTVPGIGIFYVRKAAARVGRNPRNQAPIHIQKSKKVGLKPSAALKVAVNV